MRTKIKQCRTIKAGIQRSNSDHVRIKTKSITWQQKIQFSDSTNLYNAMAYTLSAWMFVSSITSLGKGKTFTSHDYKALVTWFSKGSPRCHSPASRNDSPDEASFQGRWKPNLFVVRDQHWLSPETLTTFFTLFY